MDRRLSTCLGRWSLSDELWRSPTQRPFRYPSKCTNDKDYHSQLGQPFMRCTTLAVFMSLALCGLSDSARADQSAQTIWRLLDYVSVDYAGAVADGRVISDAEYAEMVEFTASINERLLQLPETGVKADLIRQAKLLQDAVRRKAPTDEVARLAKKLAGDLLAAYPTALAPSTVPDIARAAPLYREQCASCHGATGGGDGALAKGLEPPPIAFTDKERAGKRSLFALYQVIVLGLDGTAMASFEHLSPEDRWALAFYIGQFAYPDTEGKKGEELWRQDPNLRGQIPHLQALAQITPEALAVQIGDDKARALTAFLRRHPEKLQTENTAQSGTTLAIARARLAESLRAYEAGDHRTSADLALAAYLDGFEPTEPVLSARDATLMRRVETAMLELRAAIAKRAPVADVRASFERVGVLLDEAEAALADRETSWGATFVASLTILLREGLEALLIVVAMIAFLQKANRTDVMHYVHGGWIAALVAGAATWAAATYFISVSGASRELTEGFGSLAAAVVLVFVGVWMHGKAQAGAWQKYVRDRLSHALSQKSAWFLFLLAFVVVYREVFETILFLTALWTEGRESAVSVGLVVAVIALAAIAAALLRYSRRLPISQFFQLSSILIAILAVVLAGKGIAGLQEAGWLSIWPLAGLPRVELLGLYPTGEGVLAQILTLITMAAGFWYTSRTAVQARS